jgi:peptide methionine sulfoxide reductase MsrB
MKLLSKAEMKTVLGGVAEAPVTCTMFSTNGTYADSACFSDLDTCQDQGDAKCLSPLFYATCNDVSCKYT